MIKTIKYDNKDSLFFCSDLHHCHSRDFVLEPRGYKTAQEAEEGLVFTWNSQVDADATVYHLGDIVVGARPNGLDALESLLDRLKFKEIYLMSGNHPSGWNKLYEKCFNTDGLAEIDGYGRATLEYKGRKIHFIPNYYEIIIGHKLIVLSHYPISSWNKVGKGSFMLHGHCHNNYKEGQYQSKNGKILDIGVESALSYSKREKSLFSYEDVLHIMNTKNIVQVDHH